MTTTHDTRTPARFTRIRRRRSALAAVLLGALALAPAASALAAPTGLQIYYPGDGTMVESGPNTVAGTVTWGPGSPGGSVTVTNETTSDTCTVSPTSGPYSCDITFALGPNVIEVTAVDSLDSVPETMHATVHGIEAHLEITSPVASEGPAQFWNSESIALAGTGPIGSVVYVMWKLSGADDSTYELLCADTISTGGTWQCRDSPPSPGEFTLRAHATDSQDYALETYLSVEVRQIAIPQVTYTFGPGVVHVAATTESTDPWLGLSLHGVGPNYPTSYDWVDQLDSCRDEVDALECTFSGITPGVWRIFVDSYYSARNDFVRIPNAPTLTTVVNADRSVTFTVTKDPDAEVDIRETGVDDVLCTITGTGTTGSCTAYPAAGQRAFTAQAGSVGFVAVTASDGTSTIIPDDSHQGLSTVTVGTVVNIPAAPASPTPPQTPPQTVPPTVPPAAAASVPPWEWRYVFEGGDDLLPGDRVGVTGDGPPPGTRVTLELHSEPIVLGSMIVGADRTFRIFGTVPLDIEPGDHELVLRAEVDGEAAREQREGVGVRAVALDPIAEEPEQQVTASGPLQGGAGASRNDPGAPNSLSDSLPTLRFLFENPASFAAAALLALALLFLVSIPTELLNSALTSGSGNRGRVLQMLGTVGEKTNAALHRALRSPVAVSAVVVIVMSLVYCFADPGFGADLASLRMLLALALALFILTWGVGAMTGAITRRLWGAASSISVDLSVVPLAILGVIMARILDFAPGFFIGLAIGAEMVVASRRARVGASLLSFGLVIAVSVLAWLGYSAMAGLPLDDFGSALVNDTLVAVAAEGLTAAAVAALPLTFLEGRAIWEASKKLWLAVFLVTQFVFCLIVLPTAMEVSEVANLGVWLLVLGAYCLLTLGMWRWLVHRDKASASIPEADDDLIFSAPTGHPPE
ncbi:hypothetical protein [Salinibacterium sp. ZJ77]|uniref:hypothetical protein n=1 Tax=Salinibacterium sp. ZJ77 TaxID=2708337 RepID=UPI001423D2B6|nr:hypothetical protein [Salinibacterium sp. ZJ77]